MTSLAEANPYLRDPEERRRIVAERAWQSSVLEGAHGLPRPAGQRPASRQNQRSARRIVCAKRSVEQDNV